MTSLRARLLLIGVILLLLTLAAATALFSRVAATRFEHFVETRESRGRGPAAGLADGWPADARAAFARMQRFADSTGLTVVWLRGERFERLAVPAGTPAPTPYRLGDVVQLQWTDPRGVRALAIRGYAVLPDGSRLYVSPPPDGALRRQREVGEAVAGLNRSLVLAAVVAGLLGAAMLFALTRRIVGPVEALTAAAGRMRHGDLGARVAVTTRDEIGALGHAFNAMAERIERSERLRRDLVTDVAHELRTPLTHLRGRLEAIEDGLVPADRAALASLLEETALLQTLVADLQDLTLAEAGRLRLALDPVDPRVALERAAQAAAPGAAADGVSLVVEADATLPAVRADQRRLAQVLRNLIVNALTHTPAGGRVTLHARPAAAGGVEFAVADTGAGIAPEHLPHVFERFWRADPSRDRATGGAGLGLALVQQIVRAHGGEVVAESVPGRGATFRFTLPAA